jgi:hypothetical protein
VIERNIYIYGRKEMGLDLLYNPQPSFWRQNFNVCQFVEIGVLLLMYCIDSFGLLAILADLVWMLLLSIWCILCFVLFVLVVLLLAGLDGSGLVDIFFCLFISCIWLMFIPCGFYAVYFHIYIVIYAFYFLIQYAEKTSRWFFLVGRQPTCKLGLEEREGWGR